MASGQHGGDDDDDDKVGTELGGVKGVRDWDCPECNANNPRDEIAPDGEEIRCNYCGNEFRVRVTDEGRVKLKVL